MGIEWTKCAHCGIWMAGVDYVPGKPIELEGSCIGYALTKTISPKICSECLEKEKINDS